MIVWPLKFRESASGHLIFADDAGTYFKSSQDFLDRYVHERFSDEDRQYLLEAGHAFEKEGDLSYIGYGCRWSRRQSITSELSYVILVPTLRCNLSCSYCQVSRAAENALGYDWSNEMLASVLKFFDGLAATDIKIEFQGGEPTLRLDLLNAVRDFCRKRFRRVEFVVCTNLQVLGEAEWAFFDASDTFISTSLDASRSLHKAQRTETIQATDKFFENLQRAVQSYGERVSALPTIDADNPPDLNELIDLYERFGFTSIYMRPINHHGFARRKGQIDGIAWSRLHAKFIELLIERNFQSSTIIEEYYFSQCLRRVLRTGQDSHVDLRNPNFVGANYVVVDYDGRLFPTDEARMLYRIGHIDLSIGHVATGFDDCAVESLNGASLNNFDPDCIHCPYQAFCGTDVVDDISRYDRVDIPRPSTWFCKRQTAVFDLVFELLYRNDEKTRYSLSRWSGLQSLPPELAPVHP